MNTIDCNIVIFGRSCSGKSTLARKLCENPEIRRLHQMTTRKPREDEELEYDFVSEKHFLKMLKSGKLAEHMIFQKMLERDDECIEKVYYGSLAYKYLESGLKVVTMSVEAAAQLAANPDIRDKCLFVYLSTDEVTSMQRAIERKQDSFDEIFRRAKSENKMYFKSGKYCLAKVSGTDIELLHDLNLIDIIIYNTMEQSYFSFDQRTVLSTSPDYQAFSILYTIYKTEGFYCNE